MPDDFETQYTRNIVCPYCGHVVSDSWEYNDTGGEIECGTCGETYMLTVDVEVTYCTDKKEADDA